MKIYCVQSMNFGDNMNSWLWRWAFGKPAGEVLPGFVLAGVGTILDDERLFMGRALDAPEEILDASPTKPANFIVAGSGVGYGAANMTAPFVRATRKAFVRGPYSAQALGLPSSAWITDPAVLVSAMEHEPLTGPRHAVSLAMHCKTSRDPLYKAVADELGWNYIDVLEPKTVIDAVRSSDLVIAEAMHVAIVADALGVPWVPFLTNPGPHAFKWFDWAASMGLDLRMSYVAPRRADAIAALRSANKHLSFRSVVVDRTVRIQDFLNDAKQLSLQE